MSGRETAWKVFWICLLIAVVLYILGFTLPMVAISTQEPGWALTMVPAFILGNISSAISTIAFIVWLAFVIDDRSKSRSRSRSSSRSRSRSSSRSRSRSSSRSRSRKSSKSK